VLADLGRGRRRAKPQAVGIHRDGHQLRNALDVDERGRLSHAGTNLHEQVGSAGQDLRFGIEIDQVDGLSDRLRRLVSNIHDGVTVRSASWRPSLS
jgi:hypothetical protein